jgi:ABC-type uncharacterized transport system substrate-binding protein
LEEHVATLVRQRPEALIVGPDPSLAAHLLPAISMLRDFALAGGFISWGTSLTEQHRLAGTYVGKILKGAKPAEIRPCCSRRNTVIK